MATIKLTIDKRRVYTDNRHPVIFRITSNTKTTSIDANVKLLAKEWDSSKRKVNKTHLNFKNLNIHLHNKLLEFEKRLLEFASKTNDLTVSELKELIVNGGSPDQINFEQFALKEIKSLREQDRYGNAQSYETALNRFIKYAGKNITLDKIDYSLICGFDSQLLKEGLVRNSVSVYMRELRALLNIAIKKKLMDRSLYPFNDYKIKTEKTVSRAITKSDIQKIKNLELEEGSELWHSRNIFFLIFNLIGISFTDLALLKQSSIQRERVVYKRRKGGKIYSIKINDEAKRLFSIYKKEDSKYLISHFRLDNTLKSEEKEEIALRLQTCNKFLKRLGEKLEFQIPLTTYVARYSWANIAKSLGYSKDLISEALGHSYGNQITGIYLDNYGSEVIDEMNEKVTGS